SVRHVAITPRRLLAGGRSRRIEKRLLADEDERALRASSAPHFCFMTGDLLQRAADVHGRRARTLGRAPGNRTVERPVDFEESRSVSKSLQLSHVLRGKCIACDR